MRENLYAAVLNARLPEYDEWFYRYCGKLATPSGSERHERYLTDLLRFGRADVSGRDVLDAGSGFGMTLVSLAERGANSAIGVEAFENMVTTANAARNQLPDQIAQRVSSVLADVSAIPFDDASLDVVLSNEAISHYRNVDTFISEARRVLRPGGLLLIADGNNGRNPRIVKTTRGVWRAFEFGEGESGPHERQGSYRLRRAEIIGAYAPDLPRELLVDRTFAMNEAEIRDACDTYRKTGEFEGNVYDPDTVPLDPNTNAVIERLFDPYALAKQLEVSGFGRARVAGHWGGSDGRATVRVANRVLQVLSPVTIRTARAFWIAAARHR